MAKELVKNWLKYPHDAKFSFGTRVTESTDATGRTNWRCTGTVKAANAFGAKLTHEWQAVIYKEGKMWHATYIIIGDEVFVDERGSTRRTVETETKAETAKKDERTKRIEKYAKKRIRESEQAAERRREEAAERVAKMLGQKHREEAQAQKKWRTWTSGKFTTHAKFVKAIGSQITLEKEDGTQIEISIDKLSEDDQEFIREQKWK